MEDVDVTILGGGCSGLSLAAALAQAGPADRRIRVIEPRIGYRRDRTWCFWNAVPHDFEEAIRSRWSYWAVRQGGVTTRRSARAYQYVEIPADRFYDVCLERLRAAPNVELVLGERASNVAEAGAGHRVETTAGGFRSRWVFDGRAGGTGVPKDAEREDEQRLWQRFHGRHVRTAEPVFDPHTVTLMDFDVEASRGVHFLYVLPYSETEALVESTYFSPRPLPRVVYEQDITEYLERRFAVRNAEVVADESGCLPMFDFAPEPLAPGVVPIGIAGGACRPSTGYAFPAIQRQARRIAHAFASDATLSPDELTEIASIERGGVIRRMDGLLLTFLQRRPSEAPILFRRLFERADPDALARFMMEAGGTSDAIEVVRSMPAMRFLRGLVPGAGAKRRAAA